MPSIAINHVSKQFNKVHALEDVTLQFEEGKIYGLLGRNGAGKSTLLNLISNRLFPTAGEITINGRPACENDQAQRLVYLMSEKTFYPETMRVKEVFDWTGRFYKGFDKNEAIRLAHEFKLDITKKVKGLSTGYSSIYKLITALCVDVPYLFLDEPVLGLDANHRDMFYKLLLESYAARPRTIVISTHLIEEISGIIEEIVIIKEGRVIKAQNCEELLSQGYCVSGKASDVDAYVQGKEVIGIDALGGLKTAYIMGQCDKSALDANLEVSKMDLQKLFIQLTNS